MADGTAEAVFTGALRSFATRNVSSAPARSATLAA